MAEIYHLLDEQEVFSEHDGGAISRWAANVLRSGTEIVVCPLFDSSWKFPLERIYRLPRWSLTGPIHPILYRLPWQLQKPAYLYTFEFLLRKLRPGDLIYVHNRPECAAVLAAMSRQYGFKLVLHMHNSHLLRANKGQLAALRQHTIVFCSEFLRDEVNNSMPGYFNDTHVVYNGADNTKFHRDTQQKNSTPEIIWTGRLVPYKGVHILLQAMRVLQNRGISARCKIIGSSGFGKNRATRYVKKLRRILPSNTELVGYISGEALAHLLRHADIFCFPSIWNDPFPLAPIEAMATGLPVIASSVGGLREMFAHGGGILVPPNDVDALVSALTKLIADKESRVRIGQDAFTVFGERYLWSHVREQYLSVVQCCLKDAATAA